MRWYLRFDGEGAYSMEQIVLILALSKMCGFGAVVGIAGAHNGTEGAHH